MNTTHVHPQDLAETVSKCTAKVRVVHDPMTTEEADPDTKTRFLRTVCATCSRWLSDEPIRA